MVYRSHDAEAEAVQARVAQFGRKALLLKGEVSDFTTAQQHVEQTVATFGRLDILVGNAGIAFAHVPQHPAI
ncbi:hypothetical protein ES708_34521 [subsurface metagenome]